MKLTFIGATHEVTGSCFLLQACGRNILVDYGMEQGKDVYENQEIPVPAPAIDAVLLTHAHIDHSGMLPLLFARGYHGKIHSTGATKDLCDIMLRDSAHIQAFEAEWRNRKGKRTGEPSYVPLYSMEDTYKAIRSFVPHDYNEIIELFEGIKIRFIDVGHLLGSASIEVWVTEESVTKKIVFSGDIGNISQPLINDPQYIKEADYVIMESTYGDRNHGESPDYIGELTQIIQTTFDRGGNVVIPSFAVGRTQVLLYYIRKIKAEGLVAGHGNFKVYVDSPLANDATQVFSENMMGYFDKEAMELVRKGISPITFPGLKIAITSEDSKAINFDNDCKVIISASGMCEVGRIRHHLKHNLWRKESTILFVGHQSPGTLGHAILEGAKEVKLFGEEVQVNAEIKSLAGVSGHADRNGLLTWIGHFEKKPQRVFVVHGDSSVCDSFTETLRSEYGLNAVAPYSGEAYDLLTNKCLVKGNATLITEKERKRKGFNAIFQRLVNAGKRLMVVIEHNEGASNKDLAKFTDQINALCDKWDKKSFQNK
ncbi:MAG: MBL fold metallo-hydrolase [Lachnoclostridium sp.]|jgi:metallo-beta-lactamase family protein